MTRVAALQFASGTNVEENLQTCLRMIDRAATHDPQIMVLPEFSNHISWYDDADHARAVSVDLDGEFLNAIAEKAGRHNCYIVINVSLRRSDHLSITSLMYDPRGQLIAEADKQTLMGHENFWFRRADSLSPVVQTELGRLAMFPCRDGVTFETPRGLALRGAQLFCDSLNSFALDEASLHVPARAPENHCFLVAANKVGPLIPETLLQSVSEETHIPLEFLYGAGESQIVSPQGDVLAKGPRNEEAVVWADIDLSLADNKTRADGTDSFKTRRPELYGPIALAPEVLAQAPAASVDVACLVPMSSGRAAMDELRTLVAQLPDTTQIAVVPELFCQSWSGYEDSSSLIDELASISADHGGLLLCTSLVMPEAEGASLCAVLVDAEGLRFKQAQLHQSSRFDNLIPGEQLHTIDLPWGRLAVLTADDMRHPEMTKLAAIAGADAVLVPGHLLADWEATLALPSRAAENRVCLVYACKQATTQGSLIANLHTDFTLMEPWEHREFDGYINQPLISRMAAGATVLTGRLDLAAARNKVMSAQTDLIMDRPWQLSATLVEEVTGV